MPVSMEQWRASVGSNNAARSHVLAKCTGKKHPKTLLGQFLLFLFTLFSQGTGLVTNKGKTKGSYNILCRCGHYTIFEVNHSLQCLVLWSYLHPSLSLQMSSPNTVALPARVTGGGVGGCSACCFPSLWQPASSVARGMWSQTLDLRNVSGLIC